MYYCPTLIINGEGGGTVIATGAYGISGMVGDTEQLVVNEAHESLGGLLAEAVGDEIGARVDEYGGAQTLLPVVVVGEATHRGLDASEYYGGIGPELLEYACIDYGGVLRPLVVASVGTVGVLGAEPACGGVLIDHGVHGAGGDTEEIARAPQLAEVTVVAVPVGLRHYGHAQPEALQQAPYHCRTKSGMVHIGVATEEYDIELLPASLFTLFLGSGKPLTIDH